jgi:hypothetical protein
VKPARHSTLQAPGRLPRLLKVMASVFILWSVLILPWGCGLKTPPVPPKQPPLPTIHDLAATLEHGNVWLQWKQTPHAGHVAGYHVYRAANDLSKTPCPGCPMMFQKIATFDNEGQPERFSYTDNVSAGFRYTYKVTPYYSTGAIGPDSNLVVIEVLGGP